MGKKIGKQAFILKKKKEKREHITWGYIITS